MATMLTMNRPEGTVSTKTQVSRKMLENRLKNISHNMQIGEEYHMNLNTLLMSLVENHFKHDTFSVHDHSRAFGTILVMKASLR